ncbi:MAG: helix-turn-helix domain-containing protein [Phycisphaeraceae bacterium JB051]
MTTIAQPQTTPILANLMDWMQSQTQLLLSFEDLSGITYDYKQLQLPERLRRHVRPFCDYAKHHIKGTHQCPLSKSLANQVAVKSEMQSHVGCCYLGLTDIFKALRFENRVMGVFYFGSVIRKGQVDQAREQIRQFTPNQPKVRAALFRRLNQVPILSHAQIKVAIRQLGDLIETVELILQGLGIPSGLYETHASNRTAEEHVRIMHPLVHRAIRMIREQHHKPLNLAMIAQSQRCHPGYLSRLFRQQVGMPMADYLRRVRIDHACRLLRLGRMDVTAVGLEVGYEDKSNFGRAFRKVMSMSPGAYQASCLNNSRVLK